MRGALRTEVRLVAKITENRTLTTSLLKPAQQCVEMKNRHMESSEQGESASSLAVVKPKRSRTGCLTCRTRRRKCEQYLCVRIVVELT
jgi:hypothetical protein